MTDNRPFQTKFAVPLGCLVNMDGTAIYFPLCVVFLAVTQGIKLTPVDYVIICLLSTLASIGTTPIPSSSLVLTVMIAGSVNVPVTGMYGVIVSGTFTSLPQAPTLPQILPKLHQTFTHLNMTELTARIRSPLTGCWIVSVP